MKRSNITYIKNKSTSTEQELTGFVKSLAPMIEGIATLQKQAEAAGLFLDHRSLVECNDCQLFEDVACDGRLYVYRDKIFDQDTRRRVQM